MLATFQPAVRASASPPAAARRRMAADCSDGTMPGTRRYTRTLMRALLATLAVASTIALGGATAASATAAPAAKLTPAETRWATPVVLLWNNLNKALVSVVPQATAKDALIVGTKNNGTLNATLAVFVTCSKQLRKPGAAPRRLARFAASMKSACTSLEAGGHDFAAAIGAIFKAKGTLGQKKEIQAIGELKQGSARFATARKLLLATGGKNVFG